ncbi:MAG TPA: hypothetical protein VMS40_22135 [Vicinamibacterales bacterium]|nr:hypothetical protein [Vicinamibacterales bacterium]
MEVLIQLAREDGEIRRLVSAAIENPSVQGVVLQFDLFWLSGWNYTNRFGQNEWERVLQRLGGWRLDYPWAHTNLDGYLEELHENQSPVPVRSVSDLRWRPVGWERRAAIEHFDVEQSPVRVIVCLRPDATEVRRLESERYRVSYETRPVATLSANPRRYRRPVVGGLSTGVGTAVAGTMGGIVRDQQPPHQFYGVTCAHVMTSGTVEQPAQVDSRRAAAIGTVTSYTPLQVPSGTCTPYTGTGVNTVDMALIELDSTTTAQLEVLDIGALSGITPRTQIQQGQLVEFTGRASGHRTLKVGGLGVIYQLKAGAQTYCFQNLIQLTWPRFYQLLKGRPVTRGDSGGWICRPDANGFGWCGMLIGDDRLHGYAVYAETIDEWWRQHGLTLSVI